jgi:hypothetical protein
VVENYDLLTIDALVNAWSIHERIWPSTYELHIVDDDGESHVFHMDALPDEEWQSLLPQQPRTSEPYVEEEETEAEETEAEETEKAEETVAEEIPEKEPLVEPVIEPIVSDIELVTPAEPVMPALPASPTSEAETT